MQNATRAGQADVSLTTLTFSLTPEQSEQIDQAVYAVVLAKNYKTTSFSIDEK